MKTYFLISLLFFAPTLSWAQEPADENKEPVTTNPEPKKPETPDSKASESSSDGLSIQPPRIPGREPRHNSPTDSHNGMTWLARYLPGNNSHWIQNGEEKFLALWQPDRTGAGKGAILIVHAEGEHPSWPQTTKPLHDTLPDYGWATMAISLPLTKKREIPKRTAPAKQIAQNTNDIEDAPTNNTVEKNNEQANTPKGAKEETPSPKSELPQPNPETVAEQRLTAALKFLHDKGQFNVVLMGSGVGAIRAHKFMETITPKVDNEKLKDRLEKPIRALVLYNARNQLSIYDDVYKNWFADPEIPVIDIYTTTDRRNYRDAKKRKTLSKQKKVIIYSPVKLPEMSHEVANGENRLSRRIRSFLDKNAQGVEVDKKRVKQ